MSDHMDDRDRHLAELLSDAVSDVEPRNGLDAIRGRTKVRGMRRSRPYLFAVGGAVVAAAAVTTVIALAGNNLPGTTSDPGPAGESTPGPKDPVVTESSMPEPTAVDEGESAVPVYFVGDTPAGPRLYREFQTSDDPLTFAAEASVAGDAQDPDYSSLWPAGVIASQVGRAGPENDVMIEVGIEGAPRDLPSGMSPDDAALAIQQVIYSVQGALQEGDAPVRFLVDGGPTDRLLGQPVSQPVNRSPELQALAQVSVTAPEEGQTVSGQFTASGRASSFEANVPWEIRQGDEVVETGFATAEGWMDKLYPWETTVDVSGLAPGEYTFVAMTDDPSGGAEGGGPHIDTRTIVIE